MLALYLPERGERPLGAGLLPRADGGIDEQDEEDDEGLDEGRGRVVEVGEREGDGGRGEEDADEGVVELGEEQREGRELAELVGAVRPRRAAASSDERPRAADTA